MKSKLYAISLIVLIFLLINCRTAIQDKHMLNQIANNAQEIRPLLTGESVPAQNKNLNKIIEGEYSILIFYRGGWCPYCNLHFGEISKIQNDLLEIGYKIVAISPDMPENTELTKKKHNLKYSLYSDSSMEVTVSFGLVYKVDDKTVANYKKYNLDIEAASGQAHHLLPVPAVYIVSDKGVVLFQYVNPNYKVRLKPELLLEAARILKGNS